MIRQSRLQAATAVGHWATKHILGPGAGRCKSRYIPSGSGNASPMRCPGFSPGFIVWLKTIQRNLRKWQSRHIALRAKVYSFLHRRRWVRLSHACDQERKKLVPQSKFPLHFPRLWREPPLSQRRVQKNWPALGSILGSSLHCRGGEFGFDAAAASGPPKLSPLSLNWRGPHATSLRAQTSGCTPMI